MEEEEKGLLSSFMDRIASTDKAVSTPTALILIGFVVLLISIFGIRMALAKRKAAQLAAKVRKIEEEREQAKEKEKLADNSTARQAARDEVAALGKEILQLKAKMARRHTDHKKDVEELKSVTSWDDILIVDARERP